MKTSQRFLTTTSCMLIVGILSLLFPSGAVVKSANGASPTQLRIADQAIPPSGFIFPVLGLSVVNPLDNIADPRNDGWFVKNGFGNSCARCGSSAYPYHPGEDFNRSDRADANKPVYAIQDGLVIRSKNLGKDLGWAVIIKHQLDTEIDVAQYYYPGTQSSRPRTGVISSAYIHLKKPAFGKLDIRKGDAPLPISKGSIISTIYPDTDGGPHLHLELRSNDSPATAAAERPLGYYASHQELTDFGYIDPSRFIRDHTSRPSAQIVIAVFPNPVYPSGYYCEDNAPSWDYNIEVRNASNVGFRIDQFFWDYYESDNTYINTQQEYGYDFHYWFNQCSDGSSYIGAFQQACAYPCTHLGGRQQGYIIFRVQGVDDNGNALEFSTGRLLLANYSGVQNSLEAPSAVPRSSPR
jgi:murein DD-endopeptidase MepM/ murein hydrolase activator NlpD